MVKRQHNSTAMWGRRFVETLESFALKDRLQRGRTYAREGRVLGLTIKSGRVEAQVNGSLAKPYKVKIQCAPLGAAQWGELTEALAQRPELVAGLLCGVIPPDLEGALETVGARLYVRGPEELVTSCSCPDWASPCKHVAAVCYTLAETLSSDPLLLVELRGRGREVLVRDITERWNAEGYTSPSDGSERSSVHAFWTAGPAAAALTFQFEPMPEPGSLLDRVTLPPELSGERAMLSRLKQYYERIHLRAQELAGP